MAFQHSQEKAETVPATKGLADNKKRRLKNYLLKPFLQIRIALYTIVVSIAFSSAVVAVAYLSLQKLITTILELTDASEQIQLLLLSYWRNARLWFGGACVLYFLVIIAIAIVYTHRLVGPTVAFKRHCRLLREGIYSSRARIRKGDAFPDLALELNDLAETLEKKYGSSKAL